MGKRHADACAAPSGRSSLRARARRPRVLGQGVAQGDRRPRPQLGVLVQEQRVAPARAAQELRVVQPLAPPFIERDRLVDRGVLARRLRRAVARAVVQHEHLRRERHARALGGDRVEPPQQQLALGGVHDAVGQLDRGCPRCSGSSVGSVRVTGAFSPQAHPIVPAVRVHVVDPSAFTPPYDHALCSALAAAGTEVELYTSHFDYGPVEPPDGYSRHEFFYRFSPGAGHPRLRLAAKLIQHVPDMLRYRAAARTADVVHFQWLALQHLDRYLLPSARRASGGGRSC